MTGSTRFYRPTLAALSGRELMFARTGLDERYRQGTELDVPDFDFTAPGTLHPIMTRRVGLAHQVRKQDAGPAYFDMGPFQITYNFSHAVRKNDFPIKNALAVRPRVKKEYGAKGWSFRMLYEFLCGAYNGGTLFIDTYFGSVFPTRPVFADFKAIYDTIQHDIDEERTSLLANLPLKADGTPDMRYRASKKFADFKVWQDPVIRDTCARLAGTIRHDIEVCLRTGKLPLRGKESPTVSQKTKALRAELGGMVHADRLFYASGQLINHLNLYVEIGNKAA